MRPSVARVRMETLAGPVEARIGGLCSRRGRGEDRKVVRGLRLVDGLSESGAQASEVRDGVAVMKGLSSAPGQEPRGGVRGAVYREKRGPGREQLFGEHEEAALIGVDLDPCEGSPLRCGVPPCRRKGPGRGPGP